jgi:hypothetical protein
VECTWALRGAGRADQASSHADGAAAPLVHLIRRPGAGSVGAGRTACTPRSEAEREPRRPNRRSRSSRTRGSLSILTDCAEWVHGGMRRHFQASGRRIRSRGTRLQHRPHAAALPAARRRCDRPSVGQRCRPRADQPAGRWWTGLVVVRRRPTLWRGLPAGRPKRDTVVVAAPAARAALVPEDGSAAAAGRPGLPRASRAGSSTGVAAGQPSDRVLTSTSS